MNNLRVEGSRWISFLGGGVGAKSLIDVIYSSPAPAVLGSETPRPINSDAKWYMTDAVIELTSGNLDHCYPTIIHVDVVDSEQPGPSAIFVFEKISARGWKYDGTIALAKDTTLIARWEDTENLGSVHLMQSELEKLNESEGSPNQVIREFFTESNGPQMRLIFSIEVIQPDRNVAQLWGRYPTYEALIEALSEDPETTFAWVLEISDKIPNIPQLLNCIGDTFWNRFVETGTQRDIDNSVSAYKLSVQLLPTTDSKLGDFLRDYGVAVLERYESTGNLADINEAVLSLRKAVQLTPEGYAGLPALLNILGDSLEARFERTGQLLDISEAISSQRKSIQLAPEDHEDLPSWLNNLAVSLQARFKRTEDLTDIAEAILSQHKSVQLISEDHAAMPAWLNNLGNSLGLRFERLGNLADISEAISSQQKSVQLTPEGHTDLPSRLDNLGISLQSRFERSGDLVDIHEAISSQKKSVQLTPRSHARLPARLNHLGVSLQLYFKRTGSLVDISEAISSQQQSIQLTPEGHASLAARLNNLGISLQARFRRTGDLSDLSEAISTMLKSVQLTPEGHAKLPSQLDNLGNAFLARFERTGNLVDVSEAISSQQQSVQLTPEGHAGLPVLLNNLGNSHQARFECTGDLVDISEAISSYKKSVQLTPEDHAALPVLLNNLGISLRSNFDLTGDLADLSEAIASQRRSVQLTPKGHAGLPACLNNLGNSLRKRFICTRDLADISESISSKYKSVQLTPEGDASLPARLSSLGNSLRARFTSTGNLVDISEAISFQQKSIQLAPEGHAILPRLHLNIGNSFAVRYEHTKDAVDVQSAIDNYRLSATSISRSPSTRLAAADQWTYWAQRTDQSQLFESYHTAIGLISQVAGFDRTIQNRYTNLVNISELSAFAAAAAIDVGRNDLALEWLEQGRCLVWSQLNDLRVPIDDLRADYPGLADEIMEVSRALDNAGSREEPAAITPETTMMMKMTIQDEAHTHIKLAQEWDRLLVKVRVIPQFADFLRPPSCSALLQSIPSSGHVVAINIHQSRSDALVLTSGAKEPLHISLPELSYEKADNLRHDLKALLHDSGIRMRGSESDITRGSRRHVRGIANILRQLWIFAVKPILDGLGYSAPASKLPRIWWCVTGPLAFLPIHAAGIYAPTESTPEIYTSLFDFAVSSYTPTIRSLIERTQSRLRETNPEKMGLLMISQPDTPKLARIPGTTIEVKAIKRLLDSHKVQYLCLESGDATVDRVKASMDAHTCIHFACHASQDTTKPLQSGFSLYDGRLELSSVIKEHLKGADLAFLSACQTSTGDEKLSEEAVHLAGGMLAAGYRGVVATMWSIRDNYGPKLAEEFYKNLLNSAVDDRDSSTRFGSDNAAHALHHATLQARKTLDDSESSFLTWVPFVHFGL